MERAAIWISLALGLAAFAIGLSVVSSHVAAQSAPSQPMWQLRTDNSGVMAWKLNTITGDAYFCIIGQAAKCSLIANKAN